MNTKWPKVAMTSGLKWRRGSNILSAFPYNEPSRLNEKKGQNPLVKLPAATRRVVLTSRT
ncbi:hypothetical protein GCM10028773_30590 [Spirosoma koreense]